MKILVVGAIQTNVEKALKKISSMHSKYQFDIILCTGLLLSPSDIPILADLDIPLYFIQGKYPIQSSTDGMNLNYLGSHGVLQTASGKTLAYMGGTEGAYKDLTFAPFERYSTVDVLLTYDWPAEIDCGSELYKEKLTEKPIGSETISKLSAMIQPRYHFASSNGVFFEREPYRNIQDHSILTRFVGLGHFGNPNKERWYYAFTLGPATTSSSTVSPFLSAGIVKAKPKRAVSPDSSFFWNETVKHIDKEKTRYCYVCKASSCVHLQQREIPEGYLCRICGTPGHHIKDCPHGHTAGKRRKKRDGSKCWFCLSNPDIETHLIITVVNDCYIALAKGGLTPHHLLIVPILHHINSRQVELHDEAASRSLQTEISRIKKAIADIELKRDCVVVAYEIFPGGDEIDHATRIHHMHIQLVPIHIDLEETVIKEFREEAEREGLVSIERLPEPKFHAFCRLEVVGQEPVIYAPPPPKNGITVPFNIQIARSVLARVIGRPELEDWKKCILDPDIEAKNVEEMRGLLPFQ